MSEEEGAGFVARWSRRKQKARAQEEAAPEPAREQVPAAEAPADAAAQAEAEAEAVANLPDIDTLDDSSDFTVFLKHGVPEQIRRKALRKLWRVNPVLANLDGLNDYDEDFRSAMRAPMGRTLYKVGRGMVRALDPDEAAESGAPAAAPPVADADAVQPAAQPAALGPASAGSIPGEAPAESSESAEASESAEVSAHPPGEPAEGEDSAAARRPKGTALRRRWGGFSS